MITRRTLASFAGLTLAGGLAAGAPPAAAQSAETTFQNIRKSRKLRIAGIVGTEPYYHKDVASAAWSGFCVTMAAELGKSLEAELEIAETTWGNAVLDLQSNKIDIMFGLSPTPQRALVVEFTRPILSNTFTLVARPGFEPRTWAEMNVPGVRVAVDIGSTHDIFARRFLPKANLIALKTPDEAMLSVQSGRADCVIQVIMLSMVTVKKNTKAGAIVVPQPIMQQPTCCGIRVDSDQRFKNFVDNWLEYNKSLGNIRGWILDSLALVGISPDDVPPQISF